MPTLYLTEQGSSLHKRGDTLLVTKDGITLLEVECHRIDTVLIFGNVQFSTQAAAELLDQNIEMALLTMDGKLRGQLTPPLPKNIILRIAQYSKSEDAEFILKHAKNIVKTKIENSLEVLKQAEWHNADVTFLEARNKLTNSLGQVDGAETLDSLNGVEGSAAHFYFQAFPLLLKAEGIDFPGRKRRPPPDPVNAILSFGYTLLTSRIQSILDASGFDPYLGFLHRVDYGRPSLALDLLEPFRAPLVDRFAVRLFNLKILKPDDFDTTETSGARLKHDAMKRFFLQWEKQLTTFEFSKHLKIQTDSLANVLKDNREFPEHYRFKAE